jgi:hypothetical protein
MTRFTGARSAQLAGTFAWLLGPFLASLAGCSDWSYRQIQLGQSRQEYERVLADARQTTLGLCRAATDRGADTALLVLLTEDRRVAGKIETRSVRRDWGLMRQQQFTLRGELDPVLFQTQQAGPFDTLRLIVSQLLDYRGERVATDAHAWIAAGLIRLMQRWPHLDDGAWDTRAIADTLDRAPGGGETRLSLDGRGAYRFEYEFSEAP